MRKILFIGQIVILHGWFLMSTYLMITKKPEHYIGVKVINGNDTIEFVFYISLFVLVLFYLLLF